MRKIYVHFICLFRVFCVCRFCVWLSRAMSHYDIRYIVFIMNVWLLWPISLESTVGILQHGSLNLNSNSVVYGIKRSLWLALIVHLPCWNWTTCHDNEYVEICRQSFDELTNYTFRMRLLNTFLCQIIRCVASFPSRTSKCTKHTTIQ